MVNLPNLTSLINLSSVREQTAMEFPKAIPDSGTMNWGSMGMARVAASTISANAEPQSIEGVVTSWALGISESLFADVYPPIKTMETRRTHMPPFAIA